MFSTLISQLITWALKIKNQTQPEGNTETLVGGLLEQIINLISNIIIWVSNFALGIILKGDKDNEAAIKAVYNPARGDTYRALDTGHYWVFDGSQWNNIGELIILAQEFGQSTTLAVSQKAWTDDSETKADKSDLIPIQEALFDTILTPLTPSSQQSSYISLSGNVPNVEGLTTRFFSLTGIDKVKLTLDVLRGSNALAFAFYSVESGFSSANFISGMSYADFSAAGLSVEVSVPSGSKTLAIAEMDAGIDGFHVSKVGLNTSTTRIDTLTVDVDTLKSDVNALGSLGSDVDKLDAKVTELGSDVENLMFAQKSVVQQYTSAISGIIYPSGNIDTAITYNAFTIRFFPASTIENLNVRLLSTKSSGINAFAFYSVATGFSSANFISGMKIADFVAAGLNVDVAVPAGAVTMAICEHNDAINGYTITDISLDRNSNRFDTLDKRIWVLEDKNIICHGDSVTAGTWYNNILTRYPDVLQGLLGSGYNVVNLGAGSSLMQDIAARQGGVPAFLLADLDVPADSTSFEIPSTGVYNKYQSAGFKLAPIYDKPNSQMAWSPVLIDNEEFNITLLSPGSGYNSIVMASRVKPGTAFTIKSGTPLIPNAVGLYRKGAAIFSMGTNNTIDYSAALPTYTDTIINYHKDCIELLNNSSYLVLGIFNIAQRMYSRDQASKTTPTDVELLNQHLQYEQKMLNAFGVHFIDLRKFFASQKAIDDAVALGYMTEDQKTANATLDAEWIAKGCPAYSFMAYSTGNDFVHPNGVGYRMMAYYVYTSLKKMGI